MSVLTISFLIFSFLFFLWLLSLIFYRRGEIAERLNSYVSPKGSEEKVPEKKRPLIKKLNEQLKKKRKRALHGSKNVKVELLLQSAGVSWSPSVYAVYRLLAGFFSGSLVFLLTKKPILAVFIFIIGYFYPKMWVSGKRKKRFKKFNDGLADMITSIINSLRAGFSFVQSLKAVEEEVDSPIKEEIALLLKEMQYGASLEDAFLHFYERMPSKDLDIMIQAILIQRQVGGNLATVLSNIVDTIRERNKIHRQVKTLTAQGKLSGMIIGAMPFVIGFLVFLISPSYVSVMFTNPIGMIMVSVGIISGIIGFVLIRKITRIEV